MALISIYNVWADSVEHLEDSIKMIRNEVDYVLVLNQIISNHNESNMSSISIVNELEHQKLVDYSMLFTPTQYKNAAKSELQKRRLGLEYAKEKGFEYFVNLDCDEFYNPELFKKDYGFLQNENLDGLYCQILSYFKSKNLAFEKYDNYYVPFIHKLTEKTDLGGRYPVRVDPTRGVNTKKVNLADSVMHHLTWVRNDIQMKINNSSAKKNIKPSILQDYENAKEGYFVNEIFRMRLVKSNFFETSGN
jgi:hypothetical protein